MAKVALLVHGFASKGGKGSTDKLRPYFEDAGYQVAELDYRWTGLIGVRTCNKKLAQSWAGWCRVVASYADEIVGVGHSNGCAILRASAWLGAPFTQLVFINPALNTKGKKTRLGYSANRVHVWHSPSDKAVRFARWLPRHPWGKMGAVGYKGDDDRYVNYDKQNDYEVSSRSHGDMFDDDKLPFFGPLIVSKLEDLDVTNR